MSDYYVIPVLDDYLFYAPLQRYGALVDQNIAHDILGVQTSNLDTCDEYITSLFHLDQFKKEIINNNCGLINPLFLGLITTRGCNMACQYCDFQAPKISSPIMSLDIAQKSIDMYINLLESASSKHGQIEFFGGEPFFMNHIAEFAVNYGRNKSAKMGIDLQFSVTTNGVFSESKCEWIGDNFDRVTLSFDGTQTDQNKNRPLMQNKDSYEIVYRSAKILSASNADLTIRSCITQASVEQMPDITCFLTKEFVVENICFEPLTPSASSKIHGLIPPDPYQFAYYFLSASKLLNSSGIELITSGTDIHALQMSFCPLGKDALIVTPEGNINGCYLLEEEWERLGLDLRLGKISDSLPFYEINPLQLDNSRLFNTLQSPLCKGCFAKYHCSGGCHVHHRDILEANTYDRLCTQTRLIVIGKLLMALNNTDLLKKWMASINTRLRSN